ncbi:MAG: HAMP domain-containing histidine kinase [Hamadaea sp.]|nr:HAMP domain-containing histidine kinase [Hamadaea sp.]NUT17669.1 HAMP domain-containing histidine kinase [Hamadaea sp.]
MVVAIVLLAGIALAVVNFAGVATLKSYMSEQIDKDARRGSSFAVFARNPGPVDPNSSSTGAGDQGSPGGLPRPENRPGDFYGSRETGFRYDADGALTTYTYVDISAITDAVSFQTVKGHADGTPFTVETSAGTYRVVVTYDQSKNVYGVGAAKYDRVEQTTANLLGVGLGVSALILIALALAGAYVVKIGLRPLTRMENLATSIASADPPSGTAADSLVAGRVPDTDPHTEAGRLGLALNTMLERIQSALAARAASEQKLRQFLADASHELRTPLTSIRGFAELYRRTGSQGGPELSEMMSRIEQEAARMGLLVEDLLLLAALDEERPLRAQQVDLLAVAADTISDAHVRNPTRFVALTSFDPVTVIGDDHRLRQVATNLISNAVRHTPDHAKVEVRVAEEHLALPETKPVATVGVNLPAGTRVAVLEVQDSGPGVPPEHAERIFERLYRADTGRARSQGGSGLGLSIVAAIVAAHGGRVELFTAPGKGAMFRVLLPLKDLPA